MIVPCHVIVDMWATDKTHLWQFPVYMQLQCTRSTTPFTLIDLRDPTDIVLKIFSSFQAASDSLRLMGNRKFYDQLIADICQHEKDRITDEIDVTTMKDYMQVCGWQVSLCSWSLLEEPDIAHQKLWVLLDHELTMTCLIKIVPPDGWLSISRPVILHGTCFHNSPSLGEGYFEM